jgi:hypothetical protein
MIPVDINIDTDSNNNGTIKHSEDDPIENDSSHVGKRIFVNTDDDNKNGVADVNDTHHSDYTTYNSQDKDFAEIKITTVTGASFSRPAFLLRRFAGVSSTRKNAIDGVSGQGHR